VHRRARCKRLCRVRGRRSDRHCWCRWRRARPISSGGRQTTALGSIPAYSTMRHRHRECARQSLTRSTHTRTARPRPRAAAWYRDRRWKRCRSQEDGFQGLRVHDRIECIANMKISAVIILIGAKRIGIRTAGPIACSKSTNCSHCGRCNPSTAKSIFSRGRSSAMHSCTGISPTSDLTCWACGCSARKSSATWGRRGCLRAISLQWSPRHSLSFSYPCGSVRRRRRPSAPPEGFLDCCWLTRCYFPRARSFP